MKTSSERFLNRLGIFLLLDLQPTKMVALEDLVMFLFMMEKIQIRLLN